MKTLASITQNDVNPADREFYAAFVTEVELELQPSGIVELCHAAEIVRAMWRLRQLATIDETELQGEMREAVERAIRSKNRVLKFNRQMLREIQTDRQIRQQFDLPVTGVASTREYLRAEKQLNRPAAARQPVPQPPPEPQTAAEAGIADLTTQINAVEATLNSMLKSFNQPKIEFLNKRTHFGPAPAPETPPEGTPVPQAPPKAA